MKIKAREYSGGFLSLFRAVLMMVRRMAIVFGPGVTDCPLPAASTAVWHSQSWVDEKIYSVS